MAISISLAAEPLFHLGGFPITNSLVASLGAAGTLAVTARAVSRRITSERPGRLQNIAETVIAWLLDLMDGVTNNRDLTKKLFPLVATIFLFVLTMNWMGLLPIFGTIGLKEIHEGQPTFVPLLRSGSADLNMTLAIALIAQVAAQVYGVVAHGARYGRKFFNLKNPIMSFVGLIEFISEFTKVISFSFRLFGNVFAGEVLLLVIATLVPFIAPVPFYLLEIFVGFIQAFVFALLTLVFCTIASTAEEH